MVVTTFYAALRRRQVIVTNNSAVGYENRDDRRFTFLNDPIGSVLLRRLLSLRLEFSVSEFSKHLG